MKTPTSLSALNLANAPTPSLLTAQTKAQRLRTHAQEKRGPGGNGFKDHLQARQKSQGSNADLTKRPDEGNDTTTDGQVSVKDATRNAAPSPQNDAANKQTNTPQNVAEQEATQNAGQPQNATQAAEQAAEKPTEPFLQEIVAQVLQGVDPALKLKPSAVARATSTVSGNAAAAMRSIGVEAGNTEGADASGASVSAVFEEHAKAAEAAASAPLAAGKSPSPHGSHDEAAPTQAVSATSTKQDASASTPSSLAHSAAERAANAVNSTAAAINPASVHAPSRAVESRVTLTPVLTAVSPGAATSGNAAPQTAAATKNAPPPPPPPFAQQVQHGLEVAMHDLPAPAGDRLVTLKLNPSALGSLRIALHVSGDAVQVRFQVGSAKAKASIGKSMEDLKAAIGRQGLRVESMEVEEDRALAAPTGPSLDENGQGNTAGVPTTGPSDAGKGFAKLLDAPHGPDGPSAADALGRTPDQREAEAEHEGGVLQVLTFRLDAVG